MLGASTPAPLRLEFPRRVYPSCANTLPVRICTSGTTRTRPLAPAAHETTRLCARRLIDYLDSSEKALESLRIIDAGCGSGVLALSAAALGGSNIIGFDVDPEAIRVCSANAKENPHIQAPQFEVADLNDGLLDRNADLLLANIQTDVLIANSEALVNAVNSGGCIALSGILTKEIDTVERCYAQQFTKLRPQDSVTLESRNDGEWSDLLIKLR